MTIPLHTVRTNATVHRATLDAATIEGILTEAVARAAGVALGATGVRVTKVYHRNEMQEGQGLRPTAVIEIVVDHREQALAREAAAAPPAAAAAAAAAEEWTSIAENAAMVDAAA